MLLDSFEYVIYQRDCWYLNLSAFFSLLHASPLLLQVKSLKEDLQKGKTLDLCTENHGKSDMTGLYQ